MNTALRARILAFNRQRQEERNALPELMRLRDELAESRATSAVEAASLRSLLAEARASLEGLFIRYQALENVAVWAEAESGFGFKAGDEVRYFARTYRCVKAHAKSLLRSPLNSEYWESKDE